MTAKRLGVRLESLDPPAEYRSVFSAFLKNMFQVSTLASKLRNEIIADVSRSRTYSYLVRYLRASKTVATFSTAVKAAAKEGNQLGLQDCAS